MFVLFVSHLTSLDVVQIVAGADKDCPNGFRGGLHSVVWSVPYTSQCNPIEHTWALGKGYVAATNGAKATLDTAKAALQDGLLGAMHKTGGVTRSFADRCFGSTKKLVAQWIATSAALRAVFPVDTDWTKQPPCVEDLTQERRQQYGTVAVAHRMRSRTR